MIKIFSENLQESKDIRIQKRARNMTLVNNAVWLTQQDGTLTKFDENISAPANSQYVKQGCIPWMGKY